MREIYGFDIDGCQNEYHKHLINNGARFLKKRGLLNTVEPMGYSFAEIFNVSLELQNEFYRETDFYFFCQMSARVHCSEVIRKIAEHADIVIITAREENKMINGSNYTQGQATREWLSTSSIPYDKLIFTTDKVNACIEHNVSLLIEDAPEYLIPIKNADIDYIVFDAPYNKGIAGKRVYSWYEVLNHLGL